MIAKRVASKNPSKSRVKGLVNYITDIKQQGEKVDQVKVTNCISEDPVWAIKEMEAVQSMNARSKADKMYHLIVSFPEGETPDKGILEAIEKEIVDDLGYGQHQRVSAVHNDTDNRHIHIAINKVHPTRFTVHEPYYDHYKLSESCQKIELKYGLIVDNHAVPGETNKQRGINAEALESNGITPLRDWIATHLDVEKIDNWEKLHRQCNECGVDFKIKGAGFAFHHKVSNTYVKASSVSRALSKKNLEQRLGSYIKPYKEYEAIKPYKPESLLKEKLKESAPLWEEYKSLREESKSKQKEAFHKIRVEQKIGYEKIVSEYQLKRQQLKLSRKISRTHNKKAAYDLLSKQKKERLKRHKEIYAQAKESAYKEYSVSTWKEFLLSETKRGNELAIKALRRLKPEKNKITDNIQGTEDNGLLINDETRVIKENGNIIYRRNGSIIIDRGTKITLSNNPSSEAVSFAKTLAKSKFKSYRVNGSEDFKKLIKHHTHKENFNIMKGESGEIDKYIESRNAMAVNHSDIKKHNRFDGKPGSYEFSGLRKFHNTHAALLINGNMIYVCEIDSKTYRSLYHFKRGNNVHIDKSGKISKSKGIKR